MVVKTAWARVHACNQHKIRGEIKRHFCPGNSNATLFHRLTHDFKNCPLKFGQFIKEKHAVMGERNFARLWNATSAHQGNVADGMMRASERSLIDQRSIFRKFT